MAAGKNNHYAVHDIAPRHFLQTADLAGIGKSAMLSLRDDLAENAQRRAAAVIDTLPRGFPDQLITSIMKAIAHRAALLGTEKAGA